MRTPSRKFFSRSSVASMRMALLLIAAIGLCVWDSVGQTPSFRWARKAVGTNDEAGNGVTVDGSGNSYATGYYKSVATTFGSTVLSNLGGADVFLVKYDFGGSVIWAKRAGGSADDIATSVAADATGNTYLCGYFLSTNANFNNIILTNKGSADVFVAKYDTAGNVAWAKNFGGAGYDAGTGISVDTNGNCYVTGFFYSTNAVFGSVALTNAGQNNIFVAKLDSSGNVLWAKQAGGNSFDSGLAVAVDPSGSSYITGNFFSQNASFGSISLTNSGENDVFVAKYDTSGNVLWAKAVKGLADDFAYGIAVDSVGNSFVTGIFQSTNLTFSSAIILTNTSQHNDVFVAKYDPSGTPLWARKAGGTSDDYAYGIATDPTANVYVAGNTFSTNATFGNLTLTNLAGGASHDIFVAKYSPLGNLVWVKNAGGTNAESANAVDVDVDGNSYLAGYFNSTNAYFDNASLTNTTGVNDFFIAQVNGDPPSLGFTNHGAQLIFSWPTNQFGFVLQTGTDLTTTNGWSTVTNAPVANGFLYFVTNIATQTTNRYFRLKK